MWFIKKNSQLCETSIQKNHRVLLEKHEMQQCVVHINDWLFVKHFGILIRQSIS